MNAPEARRIAAVVLPNLLCEIAEQRMPIDGRSQRPVLLGVVEATGRQHGGDPTASRSTEGESGLGNVLWAVNEAAERCGIRAGQTVAEARAIAAGLTLVGVPAQEARSVLGRIAEVLFQFSPHVAIALGCVSMPCDCVWIDLTRSAHLWGGEEAVLSAITMRVQALGHRVRAAISDGPILARAVALHSLVSEAIVHSGDLAPTIERYPINVLPISTDLVAWLARLGLWTIGDLRKLPPRAALPRLGESAERVLHLAQGRDDAQLDPYRPEEVLKESVEWDEPFEAIEPLLFALRRLTARLGARLEGRGEATRSLELFAPYDASVATCSGVSDPALSFRIELPSALLHEQDLFRVYKTKLERMVLLAPVTGISIVADLLVPAPAVQLELGGDITVGSDPRALPLLLAELSAQIGKDKIGVLEIAPVHNPAARSSLVPIDKARLSRGSSRTEESFAETDSSLPSRLLPEPVPVPSAPVRGATIAIGRRIYTVRKVSQRVRFDGLDWWTPHPVHRDYVRVLLGAGNRAVEAWMFIDRITGQTYLHGYYD